MSYEYSLAVYKNVKNTTPTQQAVLAALAFCRNHKTGQCNPSHQTLSDMTHFGANTIPRAIKELESSGYLTRKLAKRKGANPSYHYVLTLPLDGCRRKNAGIDAADADGDAGEPRLSPKGDASIPAAPAPAPHGDGTYPPQRCDRPTTERGASPHRGETVPPQWGVKEKLKNQNQPTIQPMAVWMVRWMGVLIFLKIL